MIRIYTRDGRSHDTHDYTLDDVEREVRKPAGVFDMEAASTDMHGSTTGRRRIVIPVHAVDWAEKVDE